MTQSTVFEYWKDREVFVNLSKGRCFACTSDKTLEIAHLIPRCAGGTTDRSNLVLLCQRCHRQAPMIGTSRIPMIRWINRRESELSYMVSQVFSECKAIGLMDITEYEMPPDFAERFKVKMIEMNPYPHIGGDPFSTIATVAAEVIDEWRGIAICSPS